MVRLKYVSKQFEVSIWEIIGYLYWQGKPVKIGYVPENASIDTEQLRILREHYAYPQIEKAVPIDSNQWFIGFIGPVNERSIYRFVISYDTSFGVLEPQKLYAFNTLDYEECLKLEGELNKEGTLVVFQRGNVLGCNIALNIRKYNPLTDKKEVITLLFNGEKISKSDKKELFNKSGIMLYELLRVFFEQKPAYKLEDDWWMKFFNFGSFIGKKKEWLHAVRTEYVEHQRSYKELFPLVKRIRHGIHNSVILRNEALYYILPYEELLSLTLEYKRKVLDKAEDRKQPEIKALSLLQYKDKLIAMSFDSLCDELDSVYTQYCSRMSVHEKSYDSMSVSDKDIWDAMTDGMYGDFPDEGFDGDYESIGY